MYTKVLVPLDGSPAAESVLPLVRNLGLALAAPLEFLGVIEIDGKSPSPWYLGKFIEEARHARHAYLGGASRRFTDGEASIAVAEGDAAEVILQRAALDSGTLVALATHGRSALNRWLLGNVTEKLLSATHNPLLVIRAAREKEIAQSKLSSITVPLDGSRLAEKILPHVIFFAGTLGLDVTLTRVFTLPPDTYLTLEGLTMPSAALYGNRMRNEAQEYLNAKAQQLQSAGIERVSTTVWEGDPASEIIDAAASNTDTLIAMSTHGRSGIGRWVLGSVTAKVIRYGRNPVLVVRPE